MLLTTYSSLLTTRYPLRTIHDSHLATYYLLLTTRYLLPTTYSLLGWRHCGHALLPYGEVWVH